MTRQLSSARRAETFAARLNAPTAAIELSPDYVAAYAREIGMDAVRFTNPEGARKEGLPGQIAPGNLTLALLARSGRRGRHEDLRAVLPHQRLRVEPELVA